MLPLLLLLAVYGQQRQRSSSDRHRSINSTSSIRSYSISFKTSHGRFPTLDTAAAISLQSKIKIYCCCCGKQYAREGYVLSILQSKRHVQGVKQQEEIALDCAKQTQLGVRSTKNRKCAKNPFLGACSADVATAETAHHKQHSRRRRSSSRNSGDGAAAATREKGRQQHTQHVAVAAIAPKKDLWDR